MAIIILNWNGLEDTAECLESLKDLDYGNYNIVLVDNGSDNNEGDKLKEKFPYIHLIKNAENRGFAGGNNDGINWAVRNGFEYIVNLNNDCIVTKGWLTGLLEGLQLGNADFAASRIMYYPDTNLICSYKDVLLADTTLISIDRYEEYNNLDKIEKNYVANGAASIYSSRCLESVKIKENQFFDELYFAYCEDVDLGMRLSSKSYRGVCVPQAVVYHKHSRTAGEYSALTLFLSEKNRILNEIFNYPLYFICCGELFFFLKIFVGTIYSIYNRKSKGYSYMKNVNIFRVSLLLIKARISIFSQFFLILKNRKERKSNGFISIKILKIFYWNICSILK